MQVLYQQGKLSTGAGNCAQALPWDWMVGVCCVGIVRGGSYPVQDAQGTFETPLTLRCSGMQGATAFWKDLEGGGGKEDAGG